MPTVICTDYGERTTENMFDYSSLFRLGYGLYVITTSLDGKDNAMICNAAIQVTDSPARMVVCIGKQNYTHDLIMQSKKLNVNCISVSAPFDLFRQFGFKSGKNEDKLKNVSFIRSANGLPILLKYVNAFISLKVDSYVDLDTHSMFICTVTDGQILTNEETMTYTYYHQNVKPKPQKKTGWVCKICGHIHEAESLPDDFTCPVCGHSKEYFERVEI